jgi:hypothetical protein
VHRPFGNADGPPDFSTSELGACQGKSALAVTTTPGACDEWQERGGRVVDRTCLIETSGVMPLVAALVSQQTEAVGTLPSTGGEAVSGNLLPWLAERDEGTQQPRARAASVR